MSDKSSKPANNEPPPFRAAKRTHLAEEMRDLYLECTRQLVLPDSATFHAVTIEGMRGDHFIYTADGVDDDIEADVSGLLSATIAPNDCIVVMGEDMAEADRGEKEMLELVIADVALHITRVANPAAQSVGPLARQVGWAAVAATLAAAHDALHLDGRRAPFMQDILDTARSSLRRNRPVGERRATDMQKEEAGSLIARICQRAGESRGNYLPLPSTIETISDTARSIILDVADEAPARRGKVSAFSGTV